MNDQERQEKLEVGIREILTLLGENVYREGLKDTPSRVAKALLFHTKGYKDDPMQYLKLFDSESIGQMIIVDNIDFYSKCEHHLETFYGHVHIGYIPNNKVLGVSKFSRIIDVFSRRLQIQERMTQQVADFIMEKLKPQGVVIVVEGIHMCLRSRGVQKQNSQMISSAMLGRFEKEPGLRKEFLSIIKNKERRINEQIR